MIISELNRRGTDYRDENVNIASLYFADDGLLLANSIERLPVGKHTDNITAL